MHKNTLPKIGITDIFTVYLLLIFTYCTGTLVGDPGIGWHIRTGQWIAENYAIPKTDIFSYTTNDTTWISNQWLSDIIFYQLYKIGGFPLLHIFTIGICLIFPMYFFLSCISDTNKSLIINVILILTSLMMLHIQWFIRPVIFSFLLLIILIHLFHDLLENKFSNKKILFTPVLFLIWANLHPAFPTGLIIFISYLFALIFTTKDLSKIYLSIFAFFASLGATLINPYGTKLISTIFELVSNKYFMNLNIEWLPPDLSATFWPFWFSISIITLLVTILIKSKIRTYKKQDAPILIFYLITTIILSYMAINKRRMIPFFAVPSAILIGLLLTKINNHSIYTILKNNITLNIILKIEKIANKYNFNRTKIFYSNLLYLLILFYTLIFGHLPFKDYSYSSFPNTELTKITQYIKDIDSQPKIFNHPDLGGQLIFHTYPNRSVFIDDRNELHGIKKYQDFLEAINNKNKFEEMSKEYEFNWVVIPINNNLEKVLLKNNSWVHINLNTKDIILFKKSSNAS